MTVKEMRQLFEYDEWATIRTLESVTSLSEDQFKLDLKSSHGGIQGTLVHIYSADWIWFERWKGNMQIAGLTVDQIPSLASLRERWNQYRVNIGIFLSHISEERLLAPLSYKDMKGRENIEPLYQQMLHKVNHASYHRGQIVTMLRQIGATPQNTDLIGFFRTLQH